MFELENKVAVVTGSARGIGQSIANTLARQGSDIAAVDVQQQDELADDLDSIGVDYETYEVDVANYNEVETAVDSIQERFGQIDIMVNNAGIFPVKSLADMTVDEWQKMIDINLNGVFNWTKCVLPALKSRDSGRIVNLSSVAGGVIGFADGLSHYSASKGGVLGFTRTMALELTPHNVTVNAVAPGLIDTGAPQSVSSEEELEAAIQMCPAKRMADPSEVASTVAFLCSDEASYISGECIVIDGGYTKV